MSDKLIIALDVATVYEASLIVEKTIEHCTTYKVRLPLLMQGGPLLAKLLGLSNLMVDAKLHDVSSTVEQDVRSLLPLAPRFITVHASGGSKMIEGARRAAEAGGSSRPKIIAVTALTSLRRADFMALGFSGWMFPEQVVQRLAQVAINAGADGLVCGGPELSMLRSTFGSSVVLIVPGIRSEGERGEDDEQARVIAPTDPALSRADHVVVGRPITLAARPGAAAVKIAGELDSLVTPS